MNFLYLKTGLMPICDFLINIYIYIKCIKKKNIPPGMKRRNPDTKKIALETSVKK